MSIIAPGTIRTGVGLEVWVYDILDNATLVGYVSGASNIQFEDQLSDVGAGSVQIDTDTVPAVVFAKDNLWRITWMGLEVFAFIAENYDDVQAQASLERTQTIAGRGTAQWLDKATTYPAGWGGTTTNPNQSFSNVSMASILQTLLQQAKARGTLTWITQTGWTDLVDSAGNSWTDTNNLQVTAGQSFLTVLQTYAKAVPFDWHVDALGNLRLWKSAGSNLTTEVKINPVGAILSADITTDNTNLWDVVLVEDANQGFTEQVDSSTVTTHGRREQFTSSSSVVDSTGRADLGYQLLQQYKVPVVQKVVQFDPQVVGRRPYLDYNLGDTIGVEFPDGDIIPARAIAIALGTANGGAGTVTAAPTQAGSSPSVGTITEQVSVTLDFLLGQNNQSGTTLDSNAITNSGSTVVYVDNGAAPLTISTAPAAALQVILETFSTSFATLNVFLSGTTSAAAELTLSILFSGAGAIRTWKRQLPAGDVTVTDAIFIPAIPEGTATITLQLSMSAGTLTIPGLSGAVPAGGQMWLEGPSLNGGSGGVPEISVTDTIAAYVTTSDQAHAVTQTPLHPTVVDAVHAYQTVSDANTDGQATTLQLGYVQKVAAGADDGDATSGTWTNSTTQLEVGNDGGTVWGFYLRFVIPSPGVPAGATIMKAFVDGTVDQTDNNASLIIYAEHAAAPTQITSQADYASRTRTTASVVWSPGSVVSGNPIETPDLSPILQELVTAFGGSITAIQLFVQDNGSPTNGKLEIRSFENTNNQPAQLTFRYHH